MLLAVVAVCHIFLSFNIISEFGEAGESWNFTHIYNKLQMWLVWVGISLKTIYNVYSSYLNTTFYWHFSFINNFRLYDFDKLVNKIDILQHFMTLKNVIFSGLKSWHLWIYIPFWIFQGLEFADPNCNLYHLFSPLFCFCTVVMPTFALSVPEPSLPSPPLCPHC